MKPLRKDAPEASEAFDSSMSSDPCADVQAQAGVRNIAKNVTNVIERFACRLVMPHGSIWLALLSLTYCLDAVTLKRPAFLTPKVVGATSSFEGSVVSQSCELRSSTSKTPEKTVLQVGPVVSY